MDISENRQQYLKKLDKVAEEHSQYRQVAFDKSYSATDRSIALNNYVGQLHDDEISELWDTVRDQNIEIELRSSSLQALSNYFHKRDDFQDFMLFLLGDVTEPAPLRIAALDLLQQGFLLGALRPKRAQYMAVLRTVVDDQDKELRQRAIQILAYEKDEYIQRRLLEEIKSQSNKLIGVSAAIQLLSSDVHVDNHELLEEIVKDPPSRSAKKEAVRALAAVPSSKELLRSVLEDKDEHREVRQMSAASYQAVAPEEFEVYARQAVHDDDEYEDFQALSLTALSVFADKETLNEDDSLKKQVESLQETASSRVLKRAANAYLSKV